jgi:hypothetical protein
MWIDDVRVAPLDYVWCKSVEEAIHILADFHESVELIDIDHDAGEYGPPDYIKLLDWLEETGRNYPIHIHSANAVGVENMRRIIERNGWREVR